MLINRKFYPEFAVLTLKSIGEICLINNKYDSKSKSMIKINCLFTSGGKEGQSIESINL